MFKRETMKAAWNIRKQAAERFACPVSEIHWGECLKLAKEQKMEKINELLAGTPHEALRIGFAAALKRIGIGFTKIEEESRMPNSDKIETEFEGQLPSGEAIEVTLSMDGMFGEGYIAIVLDGKVVDQKRAKKTENLGRMVTAGIRTVTEMATA